MNQGGKIQMRGGRLYASVYCALPGTCREVSEKLGLLIEPVENAIRSMKALGLIHRSKIVYVGDKMVPAGYFERGQGVNAPYPRARLKHSKPVASAIAFKSAIDAFECGASVQEAMEATGCFQHYIRTIVRIFKEAGMAHVCAWRTETTYQKAPVWKLTPGESVRKPRPIPRKEVNRRFWAKRKAAVQASRVSEAFRCVVEGQRSDKGKRESKQASVSQEMTRSNFAAEAVPAGCATS